MSFLILKNKFTFSNFCFIIKLVMGMKKKLIIIIVIILLFIAGLIGYMVLSDLKQEDKLDKEIEEINDLMSSQEIDMNRVNAKLDQTVTSGDYAILERSMKSYLKDTFSTLFEIKDILENEKISSLLTIENYEEDGKDFVNSKRYISDVLKKLEDYKQKYPEYLTKEKAMSYISDKNLDSYYIDLYEDVYLKDMDTLKDDELDKAVNDLINILNVSNDVLNLLSNNQSSWVISNDKIIFNSSSLLDEYNSLLNSIS